jgi:mannose-6-phosphate isomerase-like protein (cupin superfamily)
LQQRGGDEVLYGVAGAIHVRAWYGDETYVFEMRPDECCFLPAGTRHEYRNYSGVSASAIIGVAPTFLAEPDIARQGP